MSSLQHSLRRAEKRFVNSGLRDPVKLSLFSPRCAERCNVDSGSQDLVKLSLFSPRRAERCDVGFYMRPCQTTSISPDVVSRRF